MENLNLKGKKGRISSENKISSEKLYSLWKKADEKQKITIACLGYAGMRTSEYLHMEPDWIEFDKSETKKYNYIPFIHIPGGEEAFRQLCECTDCQLRAYKEHRMNKEDEENDDKHVRHNSKWHQKVSGDFYKLPITSREKSKKDKILLKQLSKIDELTPEQKTQKRELLIKYSPSRLIDLDLQGYWKPKSVSGSRDIPLILEDIQEALLNYKNNYDKLKPKKKRLDVWWSIRKLGEEVLGKNKKIYPHQLRSAYLSILGSSPEMTLNKLIALSGHKHYSSIEPYISKERGEAIKVANKISKDLFR